MKKFILDTRLLNNKIEIANLKLCKLLLVNNSLYPWLVLVPMRNGIIEMVDLSKVDQYLLVDEIELVSKIMQKLFNPEKLNISMIGNIVSQLHIHIIGRNKKDLAWPKPVFILEDKKSYVQDDLNQIIANLLSEVSKI